MGPRNLTHKTHNIDKFPEIERNIGQEQVHGVADLAFEVTAQHPLFLLEITDDRLNGRTTMESFFGLPFVRYLLHQAA